MCILMRLLLVAAGLSAAVSGTAQERPARVLVGFSPGGTSDVIARLVSERLRTALNTTVIVENRPGADGVIAAEALKNATPDGRTIMVSPITVTVFAPLTHSKLRYDPARDFAPVSLAAYFQLALAVGPGSPAKTLHEYVTWVRANPSKATYGTPTIGGPPYFFGLMLAHATGANLSYVPYKGGAPLVIDLMGGQLPAGITVLSEMIRHHESGKVRILGSSGAKRSPVAPDVPTFKELGLPEMEGMGWQAFHTTARTPPAAIARLSAAIAGAIKSPEVSDRLLALGLEPVGSTPEELARRTADDTARWAPIIKASRFRAD